MCMCAVILQVGTMVCTPRWVHSHLPTVLLLCIYLVTVIVQEYLLYVCTCKSQRYCMCTRTVLVLYQR